MTSSSIASGIQRLQARLMAENKPRDRESIGGLMDSPLKSNSRHGSGHRPRKLGEMPASTSSRNRTQLALPVIQMSPRNRDSAETDQKLREIMKQSGMLMINGVKYQTDVKDMEHLGELGNGTCGHVVKMRHKPSGEIIAVKQMRRTCNSEENKRIVMDIDVVYKSYDCPYIVQCLGCIIMESEVWICMELMATCFDKLLKRLKAPVPEEILGKVTVATVKALSYLKDKHDLIHRDVKPSNILLSEKGNVKLCDFGISGRLVDSKAKTKSAGCAAYMAPERIDPPDPMKPDYDIRADVWSLGITLVELALGTFPYQDCSTEFEVVCRIMNDNPPSLPSEKGFSEEFKSFVNCCLTKNYQDRPKYAKLLKHPFIKKYEVIEVAVDQWFAKVMNEMESPKSVPIVINKSASVLSPVSRRLTATPPSPSARRNQPSIQHFESSSSNVQQLTNGASTMVTTTQQFDTFLPTTNDRVTNATLPPDGRASYIYKSSATTTTSSIPISINYQSQYTERKSPPERLGVTNPTPESAGRFSPFHQRRHLEYDRCTSQSPPNFHDSGGRFSPFGQRRVTDSSIPPHPQDGRYSPFQQRRLTEGSSPLSLSPYQQRRTLNDRLVGDGFWQTPIGSPLPVRKKYQNIPTVEPQTVNCNIGNTSPIVLQRFYHQQNQLQKEQLNREQISREHHSPHYYSYPINSQGSSDVESSCKEDQGKKRFASYIKLQLGSDRRRTQSPDPPPRLSRGQNAGGDSGQSPLSMRRTLLEAACTGSPNLSRRYISPSPPQPPPRKLTESSSVPGSPQHVRARFHYTPEPQRRLYRNDLS